MFKQRVISKEKATEMSQGRGYKGGESTNVWEKNKTLFITKSWSIYLGKNEVLHELFKDK